MKYYKFRVWDEDEKKMYISSTNPFWSNDLADRYTVDPIMQWTGLTDRDEKDIYEGDIVEWNDFKYECKWDSENAFFEFNALPDQSGMEIRFLSIEPELMLTSKVISNTYIFSNGGY